MLIQDSNRIKEEESEVNHVGENSIDQPVTLSASKLHTPNSMDLIEEEAVPDTDWCNFQDYVKYCDPIYSVEEQKSNWYLFVREKALDTIFETEKYLVRNRRNSLFKSRGMFTDVVTVSQQQ